jgi:hypothetical protein
MPPSKRRRAPTVKTIENQQNAPTKRPKASRTRTSTPPPIEAEDEAGDDDIASQEATQEDDMIVTAVRSIPPSDTESEEEAQPQYCIFWDLKFDDKQLQKHPKWFEAIDQDFYDSLKFDKGREIKIQEKRGYITFPIPWLVDISYSATTTNIRPLYIGQVVNRAEWQAFIKLFKLTELSTPKKRS